jgi:hemin uptake protein HemP
MLNQRPPHISSSPLPSTPPLSGTPTGTASPADTARVKPPQTGAASPVPAAAPVSSSVLLRGRKTVDIAHNGMLYTLQATKLGKLILTK